MKALWSVLVEKLKEVEANYVSLGIGITFIITLWAGTSLVRKFLNTIVDIVELFARDFTAVG